MCILSQSELLSSSSFLPLYFSFLCLLVVFCLFLHSLTHLSPLWILTRYWAPQFWACTLRLFFKKGSCALDKNPFSSHFPLFLMLPLHPPLSEVVHPVIYWVDIACQVLYGHCKYIITSLHTTTYEGKPVTSYFIQEKNRAWCKLPQSLELVSR